MYWATNEHFVLKVDVLEAGKFSQCLRAQLIISVSLIIVFVDLFHVTKVQL